MYIKWTYLHKVRQTAMQYNRHALMKHDTCCKSLQERLGTLSWLSGITEDRILDVKNSM